MKGLNKAIYGLSFTSIVVFMSATTVLASPYEIKGYIKTSIFDYLQTNYTEDGKIRVKPAKTTFNTTVVNNRDERVPTLLTEKTKIGNNAVITFNTSEKDGQTWVNAITKVVKASDNGNPAQEQALDWTVEEGKIILSGSSRPLTFTGNHTIKIYAKGYGNIYTAIEMVSNEQIKILLDPNRLPIMDQKIGFYIQNLNYGVTSPVTDVVLSKRSPEGVWTDNSLRILTAQTVGNTSNCILTATYVSIWDKDKEYITEPGVYKLIIKADGYDDANIVFTIKSAKGIVNSEKTEKGFVAVDAVSSATSGSGGGGKEGGDGSLVRGFDVIFDYDMTVNAYALKALGTETPESRSVIALYEMTDKDAVISKDSNRMVNWSDYTTKATAAEQEGKYLTFNEYFNAPDSVTYNNVPLYVKYVLEDGTFGAELLFSEKSLYGTTIDIKEIPGEDTRLDAPKISVTELSSGKILKISASTEWYKKIHSATVTYANLQPTVTLEKDINISFDKSNNLFIINENVLNATGMITIKIQSEGYKDLNHQLMLSSLKNLPDEVALNKNFIKLGETARINIPNSISHNDITGVGLNGVALTSDQYKTNMLGATILANNFTVARNYDLKIYVRGYNPKIVSLLVKPTDPISELPELPSSVKLDKTSINVGESVPITFGVSFGGDRVNMESIKINGKATTEFAKNGLHDIKLNGSNFPKAGKYSIELKLSTHKAATFALTVTESPIEIDLPGDIKLDKDDILKGSEAKILVPPSSGVLMKDLQTVSLNDSPLNTYSYTKGTDYIAISSHLLSGAKANITLKFKGYNEKEFVITISLPAANIADFVLTPTDLKTNKDLTITYSTHIHSLNSVKIGDTEIKQNSVLFNSNYGNITLKGTNFTTAGVYNITLGFTGHKPYHFQAVVSEPEVVVSSPLPGNVVLRNSTVSVNNDVIIGGFNIWNIEHLNISDIERITLNGVILNPSEYGTNSIDNLIIKAAKFQTAGTYTIVLKVKGYNAKEFTLIVK